MIDEGVGMSQEQVATVFDDGTQFNANKLQAGGGSGLGLNIARGIVLEHGGTLSCSSKGLGYGTTFTLELPLFKGTPKIVEEIENQLRVQDHPPIEKDIAKSQEPRDESFKIPKLRILVVDDSTMNRKLCMRLLQKRGHTCEDACDGAEAVTIVKDALETGSLFDCILLDYEMPNMKGPEACKAMRQMGCSSYVFGLTGNVMSEDVEHFRTSGANWVLHKPFKVADLEEQLIEHGVTPISQDERTSGTTVCLVASGNPDLENDELAKSLREDAKSDT